MTVVIDGLPNKVRRLIGSKERTATYWFAENAGGNQLLQFSGERDINGKEIWEGDIIREVGFPPAEVKFANGAFIVSHQDRGHLLMDHIGQIIGNIYENPELLNQHEQST